MNADQLGAKLLRTATQTLKMLALEIDRELRKATPVDTGHARRNWIPSVGEPNATEADSNAAHAQGVADVMRYELGRGALWVANVVPYIRALNYGHSKQAPAGFVERAIALAMQTVRQKLGDTAAGMEIAAMQQQFEDEQGSIGAENLAGAYSPFGGDE